MSTTIRIPLVGRLHSLSLTSQDVAFCLRCDHGGRHVSDYRCHSNRPEVITAAATLEPGQLIGIIGVAPKGSKPSGLHVERLELLGRKVREVTA
jgi:hypothetical protein